MLAQDKCATYPLQAWKAVVLRDHPHITIEYLLCEIMRRYACGLAYARHQVNSLLKGGFDTDAHYERSSSRSLGSMRLLDRDRIGGSGVCSRSIAELIGRWEEQH